MVKQCKTHGIDCVVAFKEISAGQGNHYWQCPECALKSSEKQCPGYKGWTKSPESVEKISKRKNRIWEFLRSKIDPSISDPDLDFLLVLYNVDSASMSPKQFINLKRIIGDFESPEVTGEEETPVKSPVK